MVVAVRMNRAAAIVEMFGRREKCNVKDIFERWPPEHKKVGTIVVLVGPKSSRFEKITTTNVEEDCWREFGNCKWSYKGNGINKYLGSRTLEYSFFGGRLVVSITSMKNLIHARSFFPTSYI